jgi:hypothetical protein
MKTEILDLTIIKHNFIVQTSRLAEYACETKDGTTPSWDIHIFCQSCAILRFVLFVNLIQSWPGLGPLVATRYLLCLSWVSSTLFPQGGFLPLSEQTWLPLLSLFLNLNVAEAFYFTAYYYTLLYPSTKDMILPTLYWRSSTIHMYAALFVWHIII